MTRSDSIVKIATALAAAQASIGAAAKGAKNDFYKSRYSTLGDVMAVVKEPLIANGISVMQLVEAYADGPPSLETILLHSSGEFISSMMRIVVSKPNDPQAFGSGVTYARRYALQAMVFVPSVDDDAEWATRAQSARPEPEVNAANVEAAIKARGGEVIEPKPEVVSSTAQDWREVVCHVGVANGPLLGKKLGELPPALITWLKNKWIPGASATSHKDTALVIALNAAIAAGADKSPEAPVESPEPKTATATPPEPKKAATGRKSAKKATSGADEPEKPPLEPKPIEWRSVVVNFPGAKSLAGKTLEQCANAKEGEDGFKGDGPKVLRALYVQAIPLIEKQESQTPKDKVLVNAIKAACAEVKPFNDPEFDEGMLRKEIARRFAAADIETDEAINTALVTAEVLNEGETIKDAKEAVLRQVLAQWEQVEQFLKP